MRGCDGVEQLVADGLLERRGGALRTTRRWQSAMARAALRLLSRTGDGDDLRVPIAAALFELYGESFDDDHLATLVEALVPIERLELDPKLRS